MSAPRPQEPGDWFPRVRELLPRGPKRILDAGCGRAVWSFPDYEIHRCDIDPPPGAKQVDLNKAWPYQDQEFDGVVAVEVLEHLENPRHFFREAKRVSKEFIIATSPNPLSRESRERFYRIGAFKWFDGNAYQDFGHITPIFLWQIWQIAHELRLKVSRITYNDPGTEEILICKLERGNPMKLEIGAGDHPTEGFEHLDIRKLPHIEYVHDARTLPFPDNHLDEIRANDVLEHFGWRDARAVLKEWCRALKPGGKIYIQCPNVEEICRLYLAKNRITNWEELSYWMFGGQDYPENTHKTGFDMPGLKGVLEECGYVVDLIQGNGGVNIMCWAHKRGFK